MKPRLDLRLLEVFCLVYEEASVSKAAAKLLLSQPTVSGHIKNLEDLLEVRLFDRLPRRLVPTRAAQLLYRHGRAIAAHRDAALQELHEFLHRFEGRLDLVSSTIPGEYLLPPLASSFRELHPGVRIDLRIVDSAEVCRRLSEGREELGFAGAKLEGVRLRFVHFATDRLALVAPNQGEWREIESISLDALATKPLLAREAGSGTRMAFERAIGRNLNDFDIVAVLGSTNAVKEALKAGMGASVISLEAVRKEIDDGSLKTLRIGERDVVERKFYAVINTSLTLSPIARSFLEHAVGRPVSFRREAKA